jgi:CHAD domain-containing protein
MGYSFSRQESIAGNINRILSEEVKAAIDSLENPGGAKEETIHGVRKRIKKIRALFRLVRSELKADVFNQENSYYRSIGHLLSHLRDATVMIKTLEKLRQTNRNKISPKVFSTIRKALIYKQGQVSSAFFEDESKIGEVTNALRKAPLTVDGISDKNNSFSVFAPNMEGIYRRARKALQVVIRQPSIHNFHEMRKEVKNLWYHTRLLQPIWPGLFEAYEKELGRLGEMLGDDHDFGVLAEEIESGRLLLRNKQTKKILLQLLHQQRITLQEQIYPLANRVFAEKASQFVKRYHLYWNLWQAEAKGENSSDHLQTVSS